MDIKAVVETLSTSVNAGGQHYLSFPYTSSIGKQTELLTVQVPMRGQEPSEGDRKALFEAVSVQGGVGKWMQKDGAVWLVPAD